MGLATGPIGWGWQPPQHILCPTLLLSSTSRRSCNCPDVVVQVPRSVHTGTWAVLGEGKFPMAGIRVVLGPSQRTEMQEADFSHM